MFVVVLLSFALFEIRSVTMQGAVVDSSDGVAKTSGDNEVLYHFGPRLAGPFEALERFF